jgi:hypothetical protein
MITYKVTVKDNGDKLWYNENGQLHRLDGPAVEHIDGYTSWWVNGRIHRLDGPAVEWPDGVKSWWIEEKQYSEKEFQVKIASMNRPFKGVLEGVEYTLS